MASISAVEDINKLSYKELREQLKARNLKLTGKTEELRQRLIESYKQENIVSNINLNNESLLSKKRSLQETNDDEEEKKGEKEKEEKEKEEEEEEEKGQIIKKIRITTNESIITKIYDNNNNNTSQGNDIKIVCYNVNGINSAHGKNLAGYLEQENADIICFSEVKKSLSENPCKFSKDYEIIWFECTEKKGYAGTCILTKIKPLKSIKGFGCEDNQGRAIILEFNKYYLINTYVPNSGEKLKFKDRRIKWDEKFKIYLKTLIQNKPIIWTGDLNVALHDYDVYDGETNKNREKTPGFTPYERKNFRDLLNELNLIDSYRQLYPNARGEAYTFWTKRAGGGLKGQNKGWRLDYFVVSPQIMPLITDIKIQKDINCSDHVPLVLTLKNPDNIL